MTKKRTAAIIVTVACFAVMILVAGVVFSYLLTYTPKGPNLPDEPVIHYDEEENPVVLRPTPEENYNFLVLGYDRKAMLTDVFMLVNYNVTEGKISIVQIPRDTYVSIGVPTGKINATYSTFFYEETAKGTKDPELAALRRMADILENAFCTKISFCSIMNLDGFRQIVDSIGGVEVNVPVDIYIGDNLTGKQMHIPAGNQLLDGQLAELFVRHRGAYLQADHGRQDAQKIFMSAFLKKLQETVSVTMITEMAGTVLDNLYTDVSVSDFVYFGRNLLGVNMSEITMVSMPSRPSDTGHVIMVKKLMAELINEHFNVYDGDVTESIFDKNGVFVTDSNQSVLDAYYADTALYGGTEYDADNVNDNSIYIPS